MMKPVQMKKLNAVVLLEYKDAVLDELKERGIIQFVDISGSETFKDFGLAALPASGIRAEASELLSRVENILDVFALADTENKSPLGGLLEEEIHMVPVGKAHPLKFFKEVKDRLLSIEPEVLEMSRRIEGIKKEREELLNFKNVLSVLQTLGVGPDSVGDYKYTRTLVGVAPTEEIQKIKQDAEKLTKDYILHSGAINKKDSALLLAFLKEHEAELVRILRMYRFEEIKIPESFASLGLNESSSKVETALSSLAKEEKKLLSDLKKISGAEKDTLLRMAEMLQIEKYVDDANQSFGKTASTCVLSGWVPVNRLGEATGAIKKVAGKYCTITERDADKGETPPTLLSNPAAVEPVATLTNTYGLPNYDEIDPTFVVAFTFPIIFGLMFGDVGQGALLALLGYALKFRWKVNKQLKEFGYILLLCGISSTICGFLYGSIFGLEHVLKPLWHNPLENILALVAFSLQLGLVQLTFGCIISMGNKIIHKKYLDAIFNSWGIAGLWLLWGGTSMFFKYGLDGVINIILGILGMSESMTLGGSISALALPVIAPILVIIFGAVKFHGLSAGWGVYEAYETLTRFLCNTISYVRVIALAIVHAVLSMIMVNTMAGMPPGTLGSVGKAVVFVLGNTFIFVLEAFMSFVQTLRLHYYELFSKFYRGEGTAFRPFKLNRKYTFLKGKV